MKRLLVLMLVLGIASMASAGLSFSSAGATVGISGTAVVGLLIDSAAVGLAGEDNIVGFYLSSIATLSTPTQGADSTGFGVNAQTATYVGYFQVVPLTTVSGGYLLGDEAVSLTLTGNAIGTYTIYVYDTEDWTTTVGPLDSFVLTVIPEPMTIGLLGLGGLFLRRRR